MNALDFLLFLNRKVKSLFERADHTEAFEDKKRLFLRIKRELQAHARIEEGILYPAIESHDQLKALVRESYKKHKHVEVLLRGIGGLVSENKPCDPELGILKETVCLGTDEEEKTIFPQVRKVVGDQALERIGRQIEVATGVTKAESSQAVPHPQNETKPTDL